MGGGRREEVGGKRGRTAAEGPLDACLLHEHDALRREGTVLVAPPLLRDPSAQRRILRILLGHVAVPMEALELVAPASDTPTHPYTYINNPKLQHPPATTPQHPPATTPLNNIPPQPHLSKACGKTGGREGGGGGGKPRNEFPIRHGGPS